MIELYLFVHPLDCKNIDVLNQVVESLENQDKKFKFHLIPTINFQTINHFISSLPKAYRTIETRNHALKTCYDIALDYETLLTFNRHQAIDYFKIVTLSLARHRYNQDLRQHIFQYLNIDYDHFLKRRKLQHLHHKVQRNQQLMHQMKVKHTPSCVLYNFSCDDDVALLLDNIYDFKELPYLLKGNNLSQTVASYM